MEEIKLDLKDRKILAELDFNAREPISKIAKKVKISKEVALYRIRKYCAFFRQFFIS
jgi:DNA-binding Lrp family transcriptional regulator